MTWYGMDNGAALLAARRHFEESRMRQNIEEARRQAEALWTGLWFWAV